MVCLLATPGLTELALVEDTVADHLGVDQEADLQDTDPLVTDIDLLDTEATPPAGHYFISSNLGSVFPFYNCKYNLDH